MPFGPILATAGRDRDCVHNPGSRPGSLSSSLSASAFRSARRSCVSSVLPPAYLLEMCVWCVIFGSASSGLWSSLGARGWATISTIRSRAEGPWSLVPGPWAFCLAFLTYFCGPKTFVRLLFCGQMWNPFDTSTGSSGKQTNFIYFLIKLYLLLALIRSALPCPCPCPCLCLCLCLSMSNNGRFRFRWPRRKKPKTKQIFQIASKIAAKQRLPAR